MPTDIGARTEADRRRSAEYAIRLWGLPEALRMARVALTEAQKHIACFQEAVEEYRRQGNPEAAAGCERNVADRRAFVAQLEWEIPYFERLLGERHEQLALHLE